MKGLARYMLLGCGWASLGLGTVGLVIPILPTAPFVLLAAACFMRSSARLHTWVVAHPTFGVHVRDYLAGKGLQRRSKVLALVTLWASVLMSTALLIPVPLVDVVIVCVAVAVSIYILRLPTCVAPAVCDEARQAARPSQQI